MLLGLIINALCLALIMHENSMDNYRHLSAFSIIRSAHALMLFDHFIVELQKIGIVSINPHKTMISIVNPHKGVAYITQAGKNFIHIVFPFKQRYDDNLCFQRIQEVPGRNVIYHHFRMLNKEDVNDEVRKFIRIAYDG
jgi:hypothetical protein